MASSDWPSVVRDMRDRAYLRKRLPELRDMARSADFDEVVSKAEEVLRGVRAQEIETYPVGDHHARVIGTLEDGCRARIEIEYLESAVRLYVEEEE